MSEDVLITGYPVDTNETAANIEVNEAWDDTYISGDAIVDDISGTHIESFISKVHTESFISGTNVETFIDGIAVLDN